MVVAIAFPDIEEALRSFFAANSGVGTDIPVIYDNQRDDEDAHDGIVIYHHVQHLYSVAAGSACSEYGGSVDISVSTPLYGDTTEATVIAGSFVNSHRRKMLPVGDIYIMLADPTMTANRRNGSDWVVGASCPFRFYS